MKKFFLPLLVVTLFACGEDTQPDAQNNVSLGDMGQSDANSPHDMPADQGPGDMQNASDLGRDQGDADSGQANDLGAGDMGAGDIGADDVGGDTGVDMGPTTIYRPARTSDMPDNGSGLHQMRVMWGAGGDLLWSTSNVGLIKADGTKKAINTIDVEGGGVALGFDGARYYLAYTRDFGPTSAVRVWDPIISTVDLQGNYIASDRVQNIDPMIYLEMAWNGSNMLVAGAEAGTLKFFPLGTAPDPNVAAQHTSIPIYTNVMFAMVWDGTRYCAALSQSDVNFACFLPDGTTSLQRVKIGETFTSMEIDMVEEVGDYYVVYSDLVSNPNYNYENYLAKVDANGNFTTHVLGNAQQHDLFHKTLAVEHDGTHLLVASVEAQNVFLTLYDDTTLNVIERHDLGPGQNVDLALSPTQLAVAYNNIGMAPSPHVGDKTIIQVFDR